jgi:DNA-binding transcriptional ArsR family regulator
VSDEIKVVSVSTTFEVLAEPARRQIVAFLADGEMPVGEIASQFNSSVSAVSQHLKVLREAGVVTVRPQAQQRFYAVNPQALAEACAWMMRMGGFWTGKLETLERSLIEASKA